MRSAKALHPAGRDHDDADTELFGEVAEERVDTLLQGLVQHRRRLISKNKLRPGGESTGEKYALSLLLRADAESAETSFPKAQVLASSQALGLS